MSSRDAEPAAFQAGIPLTLSLALAMLVALGGLHELLSGALWWLMTGLVVIVVLGVLAVVRLATHRTLVQVGSGVIALVLLMTLLFAAPTAILGLVPTLDTVGRFAELVSEGAQSIQAQGVPAEAVPGILFILCLCAGVTALAVDTVAFAGAAPALSGVMLLAFVATPGFVNPDLTDPIFFVIAAAAWLLVIYVASPRSQPGVAFGLGAVALVVALVVPIVLPPTVSTDPPASGISGYATGLNPIVDLGDDLRRASPVLAMTYTTTAEQRQYMRMATLDKFTDQDWEPSVGSGTRNNTLDVIDAGTDRAEDVAVIESSSRIEMGNVRGRWLPVPYAPTRIEGLVGTWRWDPETLNVRSNRSTVRGQQYTVTTETADPTSEQLRAADQAVPVELQRYLAVPESLPAVVSEQAFALTEGLTNNYDRALALQRYFRGGEFRYSENAPVEDGYDGTSAAVIGEFLDRKSGYCVHFASAMAAMSRVLGIPTRIAVGFTAGSASENRDGSDEKFRVTTDELHAWPELHFESVGWVRFEPTVGRGSVPQYRDAVADDPATPDVDESVASSAPVDVPTDAGAEDFGGGAAAGDTAATGPDANTIVLGLAGLAVLLALFIPAIARLAVRRARLGRRGRPGFALAAWDEVRDTARDLGWSLSDGDTPRELAARLTTDRNDRVFADSGPVGGSPVTDSGAVAALGRLRQGLERETFADARAVDKTAPHDVHTVLRALRRGVGAGARIRAAMVPTSVLARWFAGGTRWSRANASG
ncbi:MAG: transglutaminase protein [Microbacteriaceae bacterium]|nr:transglutaminase protein [Microbacteriaceae bacterium]